MAIELLRLGLSIIIRCNEVPVDTPISTKLLNYFDRRGATSLAGLVTVLHPISEMFLNLLLFDQLFHQQVAFLIVISRFLLLLRESWVFWYFVEVTGLCTEL